MQDAVSYAEERALVVGYEKGKAEGKANIARTMLDNNFDIVTISKLTGLSEEEIRNLQ